MEKKVYQYIRELQMLAPGMRVAVGFSGGADSTALLELLWKYGKEHQIEIYALHINHGIRGEEADRDQAFCEAFCKTRKIRLLVLQKDVPQIAEQEGISLEEAGRNVRYAAFSEELAGNTDRVALAHHQNDQAETMLFHLARGSGLRGLRGMEPVRGAYIRPFLCVTREEIVHWLIKREISWVEDATNQELTYTRNRIRHQVVKPLEELRPGSIKRMAKTAKKLLEIEDFLDEEVEKQWKKSVQIEEDTLRISREQLSKMHPVLREFLLLKGLEWLLKGIRSPEAIHVEQICQLLEGKSGNRIMLPGGCIVVLDYQELLLKRHYGGEKTEDIIYCAPGQKYHYMGADFLFTLENLEENVKNVEIPVNRYTKWFDYDKIKDNVILRTRRPGDYLEVAPGLHKKLKNYLIDQKVPKEVREQLILLADGAHIIWVVGMRISERYKVTKGTRRILKVQKMVHGGTDDKETSY